MQTVRQFVVGVVVVGSLLGLSAAPASAQVCGATTTTKLLAGQTIDAGTVSISNDATYIYVQYTTNSPWLMSEAHVAVAGTFVGIPQTKTGNPIPGRFPYSATFDPETTWATFTILRTASPKVVVAAHAIVQAPKSYGGSQTGWGDGPGFAGANWATYIDYQVQPCTGPVVE